MDAIFISYRRGDSSGYSGRLFDRLADRFGKDSVFMDVAGNIEVGKNFVDEIDRALATCRALVVVIGPGWLNAEDDSGRPRLRDRKDYLRHEIATALANPDIEVVPVLVRGAWMPNRSELPEDLRALSQLQALELSDSRWDYDIVQLIPVLENALRAPRTSRKRKRGASPWTAALRDVRTLWTSKERQGARRTAAALVVVLAVGAIALMRPESDIVPISAKAMLEVQHTHYQSVLGREVPNTFSDCEGTLIADAQLIRYATDHEHAFAATYEAIENFDLNREELQLRVAGQDHDFKVRSDNLKNLVAFENNVMEHMPPR